MALKFDNTEIAFKSKSSHDLKRAKLLFNMVSSSSMVRIGRWLTEVAFSIQLPIKGIIKSTIFKQFCGGENIKECEKTITTLNKYGVGTILDYSVEGKEGEDDLDATVLEIIATIKKAGSNMAIPFSVFKPTGVAQFSILEKANEGINKLSEKELIAYHNIEERFDTICKAAYELDVPLFIDAEDSWIQNTIDQLFEKMMVKYNKEKVVIYTTIQFYRWDRLDYLKGLHKKAKENNCKIGVKLVRGAYMEKERERATDMGYKDPIHSTKEATDNDYDLALEYCLENLEDISICAGTHNEDSSKFLADLMQKNGVDKTDKRIYFAQLLGMSDHISFNLSNEKYNVAKYVPYGPIKEVLPYLIRRAEENTSVAGQTNRELSLIEREIRRRRRRC
jgi:proline dehydrogenase